MRSQLKYEWAAHRTPTGAVQKFIYGYYRKVQT
jgi:hypothetical protein